MLTMQVGRASCIQRRADLHLQLWHQCELSFCIFLSLCLCVCVCLSQPLCLSVWFYRRLAGEAAERARVLEEFHQRRREAAANKHRVQAHWFPVPNPPRGQEGVVKARPGAEEEYLAKLQAIRRQNFLERKRIQDRAQGVMQAPPPSPPPPAPRSETEMEARRKKIAALKVRTPSATCTCTFFPVSLPVYTCTCTCMSHVHVHVQGFPTQ